MKVHEVLSYLGPNRRSERTVVEWKIEIAADELAVLEQVCLEDYSSLRAALRRTGLEPLARLAEEAYPRPGVETAGQAANRSSVLACLLEIVARMALAFQQSGGHRVHFHDLHPCVDQDSMRMIYESEHLEVAISAGELAFRLCCEALPGLHWQADSTVPGSRFEDGIDSFLEQAEDTLLPLDTEALIAAARRHDVPCVKLEREPYAGLAGEFRICPNGLLRFGHSCHQRIVDGSLCLDRNAALVPLLFDRNHLHQLLLSLQLPAAKQDADLRHLVTAKRAAKAADRVGYPVVLKPVARQTSQSRSGKAGSRPLMVLNSAEEVRQAFAQVPAGPQGVIVERFVPGETIQLLLAGHTLKAAVSEGQLLPLTSLHAGLVGLAEKTAASLDAGLLLITIVSTDPSQPLDESGGAVIDLNPAPDVHRLLQDSTEQIDAVFDAYLHWLYPEGTGSRIPLVAVTGTNGKTTTCKMIARIMQDSGFHTGMASTTGVYKDHSLQLEGDQAGAGGHHHVFESRDVDLAVLETARGGIASSGFMFDYCDVAVCLNVSPDHMGQFGINTVEDMVQIKRSVLQRARKAIVINADYQTCLDMLPFAAGPAIYAASLSRPASEVRDMIGVVGWVCTCERVGNEEWIVLHGPAGERLNVIQVQKIPATLDGTARFNISNAQHAICACHAMGISLDQVRESLTGFDTSFENNPGRMNIYRGLPFTVIMDFAHNKDGMMQVIRYLDQQQVHGKKILLLAVWGDRTPEAVRAYSVLPVGTFDYFVCRCYPGRRSTLHPEYPQLIKQTLMEAGVSEECITVVDVPEAGAGVALRLAKPGDLLMLCTGTREFNTIWAEVLAFKPDFAS